ncbi:MAG TPA: ParA family protein [Kineosporiaceae bacterium]|nr:ParA family protein [Kineosporiaceae bacterium]
MRWWKNGSDRSGLTVTTTTDSEPPAGPTSIRVEDAPVPEPAAETTPLTSDTLQADTAPAVEPAPDTDTAAVDTDTAAVDTAVAAEPAPATDATPDTPILDTPIPDTGTPDVVDLSAAEALATAEAPVAAEPAPQTPGPARPEPSTLRTPSTSWPRPEHTRVIAVANQKGGCAKTTSAVNLAAAMAQAGLRVLVLDLDPQGNASTALGIPHHLEVAGMYDVIVDQKPLAEVIAECPDIPGLLAAPATIDLAGADLELISKVDRERRLQTGLRDYLAGRTGDDRIDYVLIDCPPSLSLLTINAFTAAGEVLIPVQCEYYALEGLSQLLGHIDLIREHLNERLRISSLLLTMYDSRTRLSAQVAEEVRTHFPDQVATTVIPRSVRISEAPSHGQTVLTYDPTCAGAGCYRQAAYELVTQAPA